ncbi:MAG: sensor domain-containing diguanylate cyclase, partial [Myxococcales bacterium]|nr:sensor domain-containing diguanylate cyclase [Myxococcales bacterium]
MTERISDRSVIQAAASRWLEALTVGSRESVALVGRHGDLRYLSVSPTLGDLLGYAPEELSQGLAFDLVHPEDRGMLRRSFAALAGDDGAVHSVDYRVRHKLGHYVRLSSTAANRLNDDMVRAIVVHTRGAHTPANTGEGSLLVQPRPVFLEAVQQAIERSRRNATYGFSVLIIELARSKMLLGSYGQEIVDEVLSKAAARVASLLRPGDTLGSLGGGELAVLLVGVRDRANAAQVAGRIQSTVAMRYHIGDHAIDTAAIVGIATSERVYERAADVLRDAALASNRARGHGRKLRAVFQT